MESCEKYKILLTGMLDNELTPEEVSDVNNHLTRCAACREEYESLRETSARIGTISFKEPDEVILESLWKPPYSRFSKMSGVILFLGGWISLLAYMLFQFIVCESKDCFSRITVAAMVLGFVIILITTIRERMIKSKSDPYREVVR